DRAGVGERRAAKGEAHGGVSSRRVVQDSAWRCVPESILRQSGPRSHPKPRGHAAGNRAFAPARQSVGGGLSWTKGLLPETKGDEGAVDVGAQRTGSASSTWASAPETAEERRGSARRAQAKRGTGAQPARGSRLRARAPALCSRDGARLCGRDR